MQFLCLSLRLKWNKRCLYFHSLLISCSVTVAPHDRFLPLGERPTQFRQGDILQLPDPLSGHSEFLSNFFESLWFAVVQSESLEDNRALAVVQHLQKLDKFGAHALVSEQLERRLRIFIANDLAKCGRIIVADRSIKGRRSNRNRLQLRKLRARDTDLFGKFVIGWFTT